MYVVDRPFLKNGFTYMNPVCIGFEKSDVNEKVQLIVPEGICEIDIADENKGFEAEVEEIVLPDELKHISLSAFKNIKAKCVNIPKNFELNCPYLFNEALEILKITGATVRSSYLYNYYPKLNKIIVENGELEYGGDKIHAHIESLEFSEKCKKAEVRLESFSSLGEIKFPKKFNPNIKITIHPTSALMLNNLGDDNLLQLLQYCPEAYLYIDNKTCDDIFRYNAKNAITSGMAARQQMHWFKDIESDISLLKDIKEKMKEDEEFYLTPQARFLNAMSDFHK